ncbi:unnamed protein product, partial [Musa banksii]
QGLPVEVELVFPWPSIYFLRGSPRRISIIQIACGHIVAPDVTHRVKHPAKNNECEESSSCDSSERVS